MIALLFALALGGDVSRISREGPLSVTKNFDPEYSVVCYTLAEAYRGIVGFSCVKVEDPTKEVSGK